MSTTLRRFAILTALALLALVVTSTSHASASGSSRPQAGAPESQLLEAANRDRAAAGLRPLQWDVSLAAAARQHAQRMAQANTLSHQFPGEPPMQQRATQAGARFSLIAENVAEGPSAAHLHQQWMNSAPAPRQPSGSGIERSGYRRSAKWWNALRGRRFLHRRSDVESRRAGITGSRTIVRAWVAYG